MQTIQILNRGDVEAIVEEAVQRRAAAVTEQIQKTMRDILGEVLRRPGGSVPSDDMPITVLDLSSRAIRVLSNQNITTVGTLRSMSELDVLRLRNCGAKTCKEIRARLAANGLILAPHHEY